MKPTWRVLLAMFLFVFCPVIQAQQTQSQERDFPFSLAAVQSALEQIGAYRGARLPFLSGFIEEEPAETPEHPYYEFKLNLKPLASSQTLVNVQANISAWYTDPLGKNSGYQKFKSNGRLETDLLDRLGEVFSHNKSTSGLDVQGMEQQIETIRQKRADAGNRVAELEKQLHEVKTSGNVSSKNEYVTVIKSHVPVLSAPENRGLVLLRAELEDEFEVLKRRGTWSQVRLEGNRSGWITNSLVKPGVLAADGPVAKARSSALPGFTVVREIVSPFSGEWVRLKDKQALYVWTRPEGSALNTVAGDKLNFAKHLFTERYREAAHNSQNSIEGIVVVFLDQRGGVAAASLNDIRSWAEGSISSATFIKKCSLDPPGAFGNLAARRVAAP